MSNINSEYFWTTNFLLVDVTWSGVGAFGVGWSFGRWSVAGGRLVNDFKKIHRYNSVT